VQSPEDRLIQILKRNSVEFISTLPCEKIKGLLQQITGHFFHIPLTREEEGVGISAGIALAGKRAAMFVQSSGMGNMINALLSLTGFYELPLAIFVSQRGIYKEKIAAQMPMGQRLPKILRGAGISCSAISTEEDIGIIERRLPAVYRKNRIHAFLLSPAVFEGVCEDAGVRSESTRTEDQGSVVRCQKKENSDPTPVIINRTSSAKFTRYEILKTIAPHLSGKVIVCNLGIPSKELFAIRHQPSNFYMLGSMGMATPIGLGISLSTDKEVLVIDGDGSLLMNPGTLATAAHFSPSNLTIMAVDNSSYGSTGEQPTLTGSCVDLSLLAEGFGIGNVVRAAGKKQLSDALKKKDGGLTFIHALALPGNADVPNIPVHHLEIKKQVMEFIRGK
jgi:sulfopyruvate decarboxylase beta subunit